jgi:hypothetical protein
LNSSLSQIETFAMQTAVGDANPTPIFMRVGGPTDRSGIHQATDTGAAGVIVPNVRTAADIVKARRPTQFPPAGDRSLFGPMGAHQKQGLLVHILRPEFYRRHSTREGAIGVLGASAGARLPYRRARCTSALRGDRAVRFTTGCAPRR